MMSSKQVIGTERRQWYLFFGLIIMTVFLIVPVAPRGLLFSKKKMMTALMDNLQTFASDADNKFHAMYGEREEGCLLGDNGTEELVDMSYADSLMRQRGATNYRNAYQEYKRLLSHHSGHKILRFKMAEANVLMLRSMTNMNTLLIDGTSDTHENKRLWSTFAPEAYSILAEMHQAYPYDEKINLLMMEAFTYSASSKGILKAAAAGDGLTFMKLAKNLLERHPNVDAGVGHIFKGAFLTAAIDFRSFDASLFPSDNQPWPLRDVKEAVKSFEKALEVEPRSLRNNYYAGIGSYHAGDYLKAFRAFERALEESQPVTESEKDIAHFYRAESARALETLREKGMIDGGVKA